MKLHEYQAKEILSKEGIPVLKGKVAFSSQEASNVAQELGRKVVVKAQVHIGGRGKAGGIKLANTPQEAMVKASQLLGKPLKGLMVNKVLVEEAVEYKKQFYVGFTIDRSRRKNVFIFSIQGGVEVEEVARSAPEAICKVFISPLEDVKDRAVLLDKERTGLDTQRYVCLQEIIYKLYKIYKELDCELLEINPLVLTYEGRLVALDAKMVIDDNALSRHQEIITLREETESDFIEKEAYRRKISYVRLRGDIGIIGNGAGLVMATMDEVERAGGKPANFLDIGGGAKSELMKNALDIVLMDNNVKGIFINVFGGITRCDEVAEGIAEAFSEKEARLPAVIRLAGTRCEEAKPILKDTSFIFADTMEEGAKKIVHLTRNE